MASNDFLPFAAAGGANVISQSTYAALAALGPGFSTGIAPSNQLNKVWRQSSIMAAVLAQFMADVSGQNSTDDGTTASLLANLQATSQLADYGADIGAANAYQVTLVAGNNIPLTVGTRVRFQAGHANTGASTFVLNGSASKPIVGQDYNALTGGEIAAGSQVELVYEPSIGSGSWVIQANGGGYAKSVTPPADDNTTKVATTAWAQAQGVPLTTGATLAGTGHINLGNGLKLKWGTVSLGGTSGTITMGGTAFTSASTYTVIAGVGDSSGGYVVTTRTNGTQFTANISSTSGGTDVTYFAIGV